MPGALSKAGFYASMVPQMECQPLLHAMTPSCTHAFVLVTQDAMLGSMKYLVPVYLLSSLLKYKQWDYDFFKTQGIMFLRTLAMGIYIANSFVSFNCLLRNVLGKFTFYSVGFVPGLVGGLGIFFEHPKRRPLIANLWTNVATEGLLLVLYDRKIIPRSVLLETVVFMMSNAYLMYQIQDKSTNIPWVFSPPGIDRNNNNHNNQKKCAHKGPCAGDILKGYVKYFGIGFVLDLVRVIIPNLSKLLTHPAHRRKLLWRRDLLRLGNALGLYVALYKLVSCLLHHFTQHVDPRHSIMAGFVSGLAYACLPQHSFLTSVVNQSIQIWYSKSNLRSAYLSKVPMREILFALSNAYCFHIRVQDKNACPRLFHKMMDTCSRGWSVSIYNSYRVHYAIPSLISK